jgi:hypothetical protein
VNAEPIFEQADLSAHGPMGDVELFRRAGEAARRAAASKALIAFNGGRRERDTL